jgi:hypothetical protein
MDVAMSDFRRAGRKSSHYAVQFLHEHSVGFYAETRDVSATGMFVDTSKLREQSALTVGDTLKVNLFSAEKLIESAAVEIVRVTDEGFGCLFV